MRVTVVYADPRIEASVALELDCGATVADAVAASRLLERVGSIPIAFAIHGERAAPSTPLADGDRIELLRPLACDPKELRRRRAQEKPLPGSAPKRKRRGGGGADERS